MTKSELPTPALLLDLDAFESNLARMMAQVKESGKKLRPHAKAHKCIEIARRQIAAGAIGACVATVNEAELLTAAGIGGLLLTSPLADPRKMARIVTTGALVVADHLQQVEWWQAASAAADASTGVLVDLDVGDHRTGAASIDAAVAIAQAIDRAKNLTFRGIQGYSVVGSHAGGFDSRKRVSEGAFGLAAEAKAAMARVGLAVEIVTGGSTGSWDIDTRIPEVTELQAGSFVLMDLAYRKEGLDFAHALTVLATVVSANHPEFVSVDAGFKAFSTDRGYGPQAAAFPATTYRWGGDEFGYVDNPGSLKLGDKLEFLPPHCDPTVNLYDRIHACRGEQVEAVWPLKRVQF